MTQKPTDVREIGRRIICELRQWDVDEIPLLAGAYDDVADDDECDRYEYDRILSIESITPDESRLRIITERGRQFVVTIEQQEQATPETLAPLMEQRDAVIAARIKHSHSRSFLDDIAELKQDDRELAQHSGARADEESSA